MRKAQDCYRKKLRQKDHGQYKREFILKPTRGFSCHPSSILKSNLGLLSIYPNLWPRFIQLAFLKQFLKIRSLKTSSVVFSNFYTIQRMKYYIYILPTFFFIYTFQYTLYIFSILFKYYFFLLSLIFFHSFFNI